jgi:hypothetical protein
MPATKACRTCKITKPFDAFARHRLAKDQHRHDCKACVRAGRATTKRRTAEQIAKTIERNRTEPYREVNRRAVASWHHRNPAAVRAWWKLAKAVRSGRITPATACQAEGCDEHQDLEGHHPNYGRPLEVAWLCRAHHRRGHTTGVLHLKPDVPRRLAKIPKTD